MKPIVSITLLKMYAIPSTGVASLDKGLTTLKTLTIGVIAAIGVIVLAWGAFELGTALYQHDTAQVPNAIRKIVAGVIMLCIGTIVGLFV